MEKLTFRVPQMDCITEEQLVRLKLGDRADIRHLAFDLTQRIVVVTHTGDTPKIERMRRDLGLGASDVWERGCLH